MDKSDIQLKQLRAKEKNAWWMKISRLDQINLAKALFYRFLLSVLNMTEQQKNHSCIHLNIWHLGEFVLSRLQKKQVSQTAKGLQSCSQTLVHKFVITFFSLLKVYNFYLYHHKSYNHLNMQHKKHSNSLSLLQSNLNRVHNQHQTLRHLLQQTAIFKKVGQQLQTTEQMSNKIMNLKEELQQERQMQEQSVEQSNKIRQMQQHIHQVKQQLKHIRKEQENKQKHEEQERRMEQIEAQEMIAESFAEVEDHVREYLLKLKHRMEERHSKRFEQHASTLVQDEENKYKKDLEAEIGWVLCDLEFAQFRDISPHLPVTQTQSQGEMQRQILDQELGSYTKEATGRLEYELKVLRHQLKQMEKCARWQGKVPTEHFTHKLQSLQGKFHRLQQEREGFQHRTYLETQKLKVLDEKLALLNPSTLPKHLSTQQPHPELHHLEQECQAHLQQLSH